ncbi:hypothetical protein TorRG33x02_059620, partial [Trema orientale]
IAAGTQCSRHPSAPVQSAPIGSSAVGAHRLQCSWHPPELRKLTSSQRDSEKLKEVNTPSPSHSKEGREYTPKKALSHSDEEIVRSLEKARSPSPKPASDELPEERKTSEKIPVDTSPVKELNASPVKEPDLSPVAETDPPLMHRGPP